jgi:hypothetical protein
MTTVFDKFAISDHLASTDKNCRLPKVTGKPEIKYSKNKIKVKIMTDNSYHLMAISYMDIVK